MLKEDLLTQNKRLQEELRICNWSRMQTEDEYSKLLHENERLKLQLEENFEGAEELIDQLTIENEELERKYSDLLFEETEDMTASLSQLKDKAMKLEEEIKILKIYFDLLDLANPDHEKIIELVNQDAQVSSTDKDN